MRILVVDSKSSSLDWTIRCQADGHHVKWYAPFDAKIPNVGKGIVEKVNDPREWFKWADLIFFTDNTKWIDEACHWRAKGFPVIAACPESAAWELDRDLGQKIFKQAGIKSIPGKGFNDYDAAINYVKREMKRFVSKPSGDADKALSYVSKSPQDMVYMLQRWKKNNKLKRDFILQEFCPGVEMAVGGWFGPNGFNEGFCENFEFKKLMNDDLGVATGEQGTVLRYVKSSKLAKEVLLPVEQALGRINYVGYVDVNCIIDEHGTPWPLEFTMRPGWPTFNIQQALMKPGADHAEWLLDLYNGKDARNWIMDDIAVGVVLSIPDYPYSHITRKDVCGIPVYGLDNKAIRDNIHPCEMMMGTAPHEQNGKIVDLPCLVTAGDYVLVTTGTGLTVSMAKSRAYGTMKKISTPNSPMYRTDIGNRLKKQLPDLQKMGYAKGLIYQ